MACTSNPDGRWMMQQARNLVMDLDEHELRPRVLIHDRDTKLTRAFDASSKATASRSSAHRSARRNANAYAEHWVGSVRRECLDRLLILGRPQLERVLRVYVRYFNQQRPHRALDRPLSKRTQDPGDLDETRRQCPRPGPRRRGYSSRA